MNKVTAFTLAELLIALAILGVIATFTIPKVLTSQQNSAWVAATKEAAATISAAYQAYKLDRGVTGAFSPDLITPYINYVRIDTTTSIDNQGAPTSAMSCSWGLCIVLHNGGYIFVPTSNTFGQTTETNFVPYWFDPDGKQSNISSVLLFLYPSGKVTTSNGVKAGDTTYQGGSPAAQPGPYATAPWFSWN